MHAGSSSSSDQIQGYSNHSNRATPVEELYDMPSTPTHEYDYPSVQINVDKQQYINGNMSSKMRSLPGSAVSYSLFTY